MALLLGLTALRLVVAAWLPLSPDEAYYWVWSRALAPGYLDHPPMVALWIAAGAALLGDGALGVRLLAPLGALAGSLLLADAAECLLPGRRAGVWAAATLNATLLFGVGSVTMTPDTPLLLFWTATLWALARLHASNRGQWWLVAGAAAGLALDSKYTAVMMAPAILVWLLAVPTMRFWLVRWQPWAAAAIGLLLFAPVLAWNAAHGWASFLRQGGRAADWRPERAVQFVAELLAGQLGLATPLLGALFAAGMAAAARGAWRRDAAWTLLAAFSLLPAAVFLQHALGDRVQANWPAICFPAACIAGAGLARPHGRGPGLALGAAMTLLVWLQGVAAPVALPRRLDPTLIRLGGWPDLARQVRAAADADHAAFVAIDEYGLASMLARLLPPGLAVVGIDRRWAYFGFAPATSLVAGRGLLLRSVRRGTLPAAGGWIDPALAGEAIRSRDGIQAEAYRLFQVSGRVAAPPAWLLPRP